MVKTMATATKITTFSGLARLFVFFRCKLSWTSGKQFRLELLISVGLFRVYLTPGPRRVLPRRTFIMVAPPYSCASKIGAFKKNRTPDKRKYQYFWIQFVRRQGQLNENTLAVVLEGQH